MSYPCQCHDHNAQACGSEHGPRAVLPSYASRRPDCWLEAPDLTIRMNQTTALRTAGWLFCGASSALRQSVHAVVSSLLLLVVSVMGAEPRRVLVVHSFGNAAPPFTTHSMAFETKLIDEMGDRVDLDEVSLDVARYATLDMEEALVEFMRKRQAKWQPDLVVPIGSPAGVFVAQYRDRLFPQTTPVIYTGMDQRRLPPGALQQNAAFVGTAFDFVGMMEDMLQLAPATTNIAVVIGASQLEQFWAGAIRQEWAPFTNRLGFTWLNDLSFDQMLERVSKLPPRSFIFLILLMRDASGVTHNADEALKRIHAVANAPVNSIFQHQLGLGIVGGRLYQAELEGEESARIAIRVLRGESPTNFPPVIVAPLGPRYDHRELQRWNINEANLPKGSAVLFREATPWELYKWRIIAITFICVGQAVLIFLLLANLAKRRRAEQSLRENEGRMALAADAARLGMWIWDLRGNGSWFSERCGPLFGYAEDIEMTHEHLRARIHPEDRARRDAVIEQAIANGGRYALEYRVQLPDGKLRWFAGTGRVDRDAAGQPLRLRGVSIDITERKLAEDSAREVGGKLITAQEDERKRIARDLHDDLNQRLALLSVDADLLGRIAKDAPAQTLIKGIASRVRELSTDVHKLSYQLHPAKLEQLGLVAATRSLCHEQSKFSNVAIDLLHDAIPHDLNNTTALCIYRIIQESLQNIGKHSQATCARVELRKEGSEIRLVVSDNGCGFDLTTVADHAGLGLVGIRERVRLARGRISFQSAPGEGTRIEVIVPIELPE